LVDLQDRVPRPPHLGRQSEAKTASGRWIEERFNRKRSHSSIGILAQYSSENTNLRWHKPRARAATVAGEAPQPSQQTPTNTLDLYMPTPAGISIEERIPRSSLKGL